MWKNTLINGIISLKGMILMKIIEITPADKYLKKINDLRYDIEVAKTYKIYSTGVCLLLAALNVSHISQLSSPDFLDIVRQAALSISFAYSAYYTNKVFKDDKRNHEKLGRYENLYYEATKDDSIFLRDKYLNEPTLIEEQYGNSGRHR